MRLWSSNEEDDDDHEPQIAASFDKDDGDDDDTSLDLDQAWKDYSATERKRNGPTTTDGLFKAKKDDEMTTPNLAVAYFFLAMTFFIGILYGQLLVSPSDISSQDWSVLEDVDSAKGRFEALTGGVWF